MKVHPLLLALAGALALAGPAAAQTATRPAIEAGLSVDGTPAVASDFSARLNHRFAAGAPLTFYLDIYNMGAATTLTFADPARAVEITITDAAGAEVRTIAVAAPAAVPLGANETYSLKASWDQADDAGRQVALGFYGYEVAVRSSPRVRVEDGYLRIGDVASQASDFGVVRLLSARTIQPGQRVAAGLRVLNLTSRPQAIDFRDRWLPTRLAFHVEDARGKTIWTWSAPIPMMMYIGPFADYFAPFQSRTYGPVAWPGRDEQGNPVAAGTYTLVQKLLGTPAGHDQRMTVRVAGRPARPVAVKLSSQNGSLNVRTGASVTSPRVGTLGNGARVDVLVEASGWAKISGDDSRTGQVIIGWVAKRYLDFNVTP